MKREDKDLLVIDLSARLPYGVIVAIKSSNHEDWDDWVVELTYKDLGFFDNDVIYDYVKPYLRPMSSMTEEEEKEYHNLCYEEESECYEFGEWTTKIYVHNTIESIDWLNSFHFDYRGLIEKGLAIEVTEENNPYKD